MTRDDLLASARTLPAFAAGAADLYAACRAAMVVEVDRQLLDRPDLDDLIGPGNRDLMRDNHRHHAEFVESLLRRYDPEVLTEAILWVFTTYRARGFRPAYWPVELAAWMVVMERALPPVAYAAAVPLYRWMLDHCSHFTALTDPPQREPGSEPEGEPERERAAGTAGQH